MKRKKLDFEFGPFTVRITEKLVDIETNDKQWKVQFKKQTKEYAQILFLASKDEKRALETLSKALFYSRLIIQDPVFTHMFTETVKKYYEDKSAKAKEISKEEDDKILEEEKILHENK